MREIQNECKIGEIKNFLVLDLFISDDEIDRKIDSGDFILSRFQMFVQDMIDDGFEPYGEISIDNIQTEKNKGILVKQVVVER
jgi:hypothetical protein